MKYLVAGANDEGVNHGANVNARDNEALRWASYYGHFDIVAFLKEKLGGRRKIFKNKNI